MQNLLLSKKNSVSKKYKLETKLFNLIECISIEIVDDPANFVPPNNHFLIKLFFNNFSAIRDTDSVSKIHEESL